MTTSVLAFYQQSVGKALHIEEAHGYLISIAPVAQRPSEPFKLLLLFITKTPNILCRTGMLIYYSFYLDLPPVKPSAIALGTIFNHTASLAILAPVFGDTYSRAQAANSKEEFFKSKEAASAAAAWGSSLVGSAIQSYGVGALINATGTLSYKGAAYLGSLIFMASSAPSVCSFYLQVFLLY